MNWDTWFRLPTTLLLVLAAIFLLITLFQLVVLRQCVRGGRRLAASGRALVCLLSLALTLLLATSAIAVRGYRLLGEEAPVVDIDARILSPQRWALTLSWPDGSTRDVQLSGDAWRVEAVVLKWKRPALLVGLPPLYRLDRLSGRYDDPVQEAEAPRSVIGFGQTGALDLLHPGPRQPRWLPAVDTIYGSGVFLPLVDQGHYSVSLMRTGALVARPDEATERRIGQPLGR